MTYVGAVLAIAAVVAAAVLVGPQIWDRVGASDQTPPGAEPAPGETHGTFAIASVHPTDPSAGATTLVIIGHDPSEASSTLLFVPVSTMADIPGHGLDELAKAYAYGGSGLLHATVENLIGLRIEGVATVTDRGWERLVGSVGGVSVELDRGVTVRDQDGSAAASFDGGSHDLDGTQAARLIATQASDESELDRLARVRRIVAALLRATAEDESELTSLEEGRVTAFSTDLDPRRVGGSWAAAARAAADDRLDGVVLPVVRAGEGGGFRVDRERAETLLADRFPGGLWTAEELAGRRLRVLNGNGAPGVGQEVAERVVPAGFRIVLSDNADHFDHETTRVIIHGDDAALIDGAREIVRHLGVGTIDVTPTAQSVADLTVIVGHDFPADGTDG